MLNTWLPNTSSKSVALTWDEIHAQKIWQYERLFFSKQTLTRFFSLLQTGKLIPHIRRGIMYVHTVLSHHFLMDWHFFCYSLITSHCPAYDEQAIKQELSTQWVLGPSVSRFCIAVQLKRVISPVSLYIMWSWQYTLVVVTIKSLSRLVIVHCPIVILMVFCAWNFALYVSQVWLIFASFQ